MLPPNISSIEAMIFVSAGFSVVSNAERDGMPTATTSISAATISGAGKFSESPDTAFTLKSLDI